jgi:two-component system KDP operon response regulator KdpE
MTSPSHDATAAPPSETAPSQRARVLVIDDEPEIGTAVRVGLTGSAFTVQWEATAREGMERINSWHPDVVILDLSLPDMDGITVCKEIRKWSQVPIIILSVRDKDTDKVAALDNGADDYLTKPFSIKELSARLRVALRHAAQGAGGTSSDAVVQLGDLTLDLARRSVVVRGEAVHLNPTEYEVLKYLAQHAGQVVTHQTLLRAVWGPHYEDAVQNLRVTIAQLRRKLERDPSRPKLVLTDPGIGYRLRMPDDR